MLGLKLPTDPRWANLAEKSLEEILTDHAYCEQKATTTCISLIQSYPERERLVKELSPVVTEEWGHFRLVIQELEKRGLKLGKQRRDEYVNELLTFMKQTETKNERLMERLLVSALIEARSCERFRVLSINIEDDELKEFYHKFMVAEAAHYRMFLDLAEEYYDKEKVRTRWEEYLEFEKGLMERLDVRGDRVH